MLLQNEWAVDTLIKANEETGMVFEINDGEITGVQFEGGTDND